MNKLYLLMCFFCLSLAVSAQNAQQKYIININNEESVVEGELKTAGQCKYVSTPEFHYQVDNETEIKLGDVDRDNTIDVADVTGTIDLILEDNPYLWIADVDEDDKVDVADVTTIISVILEEDDVKIRTIYDVTDVTNVWIKDDSVDDAVDQN